MNKSGLIFLLCSLTIISCTTFNVESTLAETSENWQLALQNGPKSVLTAKNRYKVLTEIAYSSDDRSMMKNIFRYLRTNYRQTSPVDGANVRSCNLIVESKELRHCGEWGVMLITLFRLYGIPCEYIQALRIADAKPSDSWGGHVFIYVNLDGEDTLIDSTQGLLYRNYDKSNPILPIKIGSFETTGFIEMFRCIDPGNVLGETQTFRSYLDNARKLYSEHIKPKMEYLPVEKI